MAPTSVSVGDNKQGAENNTGPCTLIICFDGTMKEIGGYPTNVSQFFSTFVKTTSRQLCKFIGGPGTSGKSKIGDPVAAAFGSTVSESIKEGYKFLVENYTDGSKIYMFGFSRGGYAARALAGMVCKVGLLSRGNVELIDKAYKLYVADDVKGWRASLIHKTAWIDNVNIDFLGVWDTVVTIGSPITPEPYLPFTRKNPSVKTFRHAVSLDERRVLFYPYLNHSLPQPDCEKDKLEIDYFDQYVSTKNFEHREDTDSLEVWFAGCHSDVGGNYKITGRTQDRKPSLGVITLRWMFLQCQLADRYVDILYDQKKLAGVLQLQGDAELLLEDLQNGPSELVKRYKARLCNYLETHLGRAVLEADLKDAESQAYHANGEAREESMDLEPKPPAYSERAETLRAVQPLDADFADELETAENGLARDSLLLKKSWWFFERAPVRIQKCEGTSLFKWKLNKGRGRVVRTEIKVHYTVAVRIHHSLKSGTPYHPRLRYHGEAKRFPEKVDWWDWDCMAASVAAEAATGGNLTVKGKLEKLLVEFYKNDLRV